MRGSVRSFWSRHNCSSSSIVVTRKCSNSSAMLFRPEPLDLQKLERGGGKLEQQFIALVATAVRFDLLQHCREPLADPRNIGDLALRVCENVGDALRIAFDRGRAIAIAADAKAVFARDLHQVGGLVENPREFAIFQAFSLLAAWS